MGDVVEQQPPAVQGVGIMVSYRELVEIRTQMTSMGGKLDAAMALLGRVNSMDTRLGKVENILSGKAGERRTWNTIAGFIVGLVTAALAGGAVLYLPHLGVVIK